MKKTLFTALIGATLLTACNDKSAETVQQQAQQIAELTEQLKQTQGEQALKPSRQVIFDQHSELHLPDDITSYVASEVSSQKTQREWLDKLLDNALREAVLAVTQEKTDLPLGEYLSQRFARSVQHKGDFPLGEYLSAEVNFINQRANLASFYVAADYVANEENWQNVAHYLLVDLNSQKVLTVKDVFNPNALERLKTALYWHYGSDDPESEEKSLNKENFFISDNFYFTADGVHFIYPSEVEGTDDIDLKISWNDIVEDDLIKKEYVPVWDKRGE